MRTINLEVILTGPDSNVLTESIGSWLSKTIMENVGQALLLHPTDTIKAEREKQQRSEERIRLLRLPSVIDRSEES